MSVLFQRFASEGNQIPPATGLMVWARREDQISHLLAGLSNQDAGIREQAVRSLLLTYFQKQNRLPLQEASDRLEALPAEGITRLTQALLRLANDYQWE